MIETFNRQLELFARIRVRMKDPADMVEELSSLLQLSKDSVYRRIKGEKPLLFEEIALLARTYDISLDEILGVGAGQVVFRGQFVNEVDFHLSHYLGSVVKNLGLLNSMPDARLYYISKDITLFYYLMFPTISAFKFFVWSRSQMQFPSSRDQLFTMDIMTSEIHDLCAKAAGLYISIPSVEVLNADNILNDLRQLMYLHDAGLVTDRQDLEAIFNELNDMVSHMELQAAGGVKSIAGSGGKGANLQLYVNDFYVGDNTVIATAAQEKMVYLNHAAINFLSTQSREFADYNMEFTANLIRKSTLISETGERTRTRFFSLIRQRIQRYRDQLLP